MIHQTRMPIRTFHTDGFGHVNNSRYLELLEEARWRFAEDIGLVELMRTENLGFIIIDLRLRFRKPVVEGEIVTIETHLKTLGTGSGDVIQSVVVERGSGEKASASLKGEFHFILIDRENGKSVPIDGAIRRCLLDVLES